MKPEPEELFQIHKTLRNAPRSNHTAGAISVRKRRVRKGATVNRLLHQGGGDLRHTTIETRVHQDPIEQNASRITGPPKQS